MATWSVAFPARTQYALVLGVSETSSDSANNQSTVTFTLYIDPPSPAGGAYDLGTSSSYSVTINGTTYTGNYAYDFRSSTSNLVLRTGTRPSTHATNGSKTITVYASTAAATPLGSASIGAQSLPLTDFTRVPTTPGTPTLSRTGSSVTATTTGSTFYGSGGYYSWNYNLDGGSWSTPSGSSSSITFDAGSSTATINVRVYAQDSEGGSAASGTATIAGAPASISTTRTGRNVTVVAGNSTGTGIDNYYVQYSTDSGSTWSTAVAMTSQSYTYNALTPAFTYIFRVYSHNSIGNSTYTTASGLFVPAGGSRWNGTAWSPTSIAKRWNGSAWVDITIAKRWNGSAWVDLS